MAEPLYQRMGNRQVACVNMRALLADVFAVYREETMATLSGRIGRPVDTIKTWRRTNRARRGEAERLLMVYPLSRHPGGEVLEEAPTLAQLLETIQNSFDQLRRRLVA